MTWAKQISGLILHQRYPRLTFAVLLAMLVHATVLLTGALSISLFSAPSDVNRSLTITLDSSTIEGLKESKEHDQETVNKVQKAQANAPKRETVKEQESVKEQENRLEETENLTELENEPQLASIEQPNLEQISNTESPIAEVFETELANQDSVTSDLAESQSQQQAAAKSNDEVQSTQIAQVSGETIDVEESVELILASEGLVNLPRRQSEPVLENPIDSPPTAIASHQAISAKQQKAMVRKVQRRLRKLVKSDFAEANISWSHKGQAFLAKVTPIPANDNMLMDQVLVDVITEQDGKKLTTTLRLKQLAFSNFAQFIDRWDDRVSMHDDEMNGRFHSNTAFKITANYKAAPRFHAKATTAARSPDFGGFFSRAKVFLAGLETGVKTIRMPKPSVLFEAGTQLQDPKESKTVVIREDSRLIFKANGSVIWQALDSAQPIRKYELADQPNYFIAAPGVELRVRGIVNGLAAIYSPKRITIEGDIRYASRDPIDKGGDVLGLISGRSIYLAKRKILGTGDLQVDAAIYAKDRFSVPDIRGSIAGTLSVFGSVTSSSISATQPRYATRIDFDPRLEHMRPPGFPVTERFEMVAEKLKWRVVEEVYREQESITDLTKTDS